MLSNCYLLLLLLHGNPMIVYIDETFHVMIARAEEDQMEDMLFTGGDHNDQGFLTWKRIK